ncbi:K(+)-transporting ATPase subunit F [Corynebacterium kroppenstedtii]|uniref:K(+)-transporting ATPase subunit F n=1 Tax=Corynebacterium kroppenstedtii TaxID=161879 RepID=A0A2W5SWB3_9CORY|nr:K(+)-transporting ATPase subunit F [Corynebacterium kroppenstedtii]MDU7286631.1 K(+)-transporting ATPase subunit F [Corynebacterium kroppenstedtii]PZR05083.1 MAG: K(+)-transporting ATPase subunit F [Corynebacterium kroppenstedtii]
MIWELITGGILGILAIVYLLIALLNPEKFS